MADEPSSGHRPLVSIVVPSLNRAEFLRPTIDSILVQDHKAVECLVIDGGSTDGTLDILRSYGSRITWVSEPDAGHADAINKGWRMSRGTILAWLNADDVYVQTDAVSRVVRYFLADENLDLVYGDYVELDARGNVITDPVSPRAWDLVEAVLYCDHIIPQAAAFMRRSILEQTGWLDPEFQYCKDHELWLRIGLVGSIRYVPGLIAGVRRIPGISQHLATSHAKVRLTQKFLSRPDLPEPLSRAGFRRTALSNAHLVGALYALESGYVVAGAIWAARAFVRDPRNGPYVAYRLGQYMSSRLLSVRQRQTARRLLERSGLMARMTARHRIV